MTPAMMNLDLNEIKRTPGTAPGRRKTAPAPTWRRLAMAAVTGWLTLCGVERASAVRIMTNPATEPGDPAVQFDNITFTPDGSTIVATGLFNTSLTGDRVYSLAVPADPVTTTANVTQLSTGSFLVSTYDAAFAPVVSPDGQTVLFVHDGNSTVQNTIYTMPITGEFGANSFTGLFGADPNLAPPGDGNSYPVYSPDGATVFFLNNNSGFNGSTPIFPTSPTPFYPAPDWDQIYRVPAGGGTPVAVTMPGDGDIDGGLFTVTPDGQSIIYAPGEPVVEGKDRGGNRTTLYSIPVAGGTPTAIAVTGATHDFSIKTQLSLTPDGQNALFIADYETVGKNELFSVPITGGVPTRVNGALPFGGDVYSFAIAPDGASVAYSAGQNASGTSELFLAPVGGGSSVRISDAPLANTGEMDVSTSGEGGQILFSNDSSKVYYLGDMTTEGVSDLYVVDTTEKSGLTPSPYRFVGPAGGDFFDENNWEDADGNKAPADTINPATPIRHSLLIDGDSVGTSGGEADFQVGGSLELTPGSELIFPNAGDEIDFNPGSALRLDNATLRVYEDIFLEGTNDLHGGLIETIFDDIEFQDGHETVIDGTTLRSADGFFFENSMTSVFGATMELSVRMSLRYEVDVTVTDTSIDVNGGIGDVEDGFNSGSTAQGEGSTLTLRGASTLLANAIEEGVSLVIDGTSIATLLGDANTSRNLVDANGTITFLSTGAELITLTPSASDARSRVINGLTGLSYLDDPLAWSVTDWDGVSTLASLKLIGGLPGDFNDDGKVDGADFLAWQRGESASPRSPEDLADWQSNFGVSAASPTAAGVPEPNAMGLGAMSCAALVVAARTRRRRISRRQARVTLDWRI